MEEHMKRPQIQQLPISLPVALLIVFLFSGCASPRGWAYKGLQPSPDRAPILGKSVAVIPFADDRPTQNSNNWMLYAIPLMPYGWQELNTPETVDRHLTSGLWQFKPTEDIAKAVAAEINNRRIFKEAFFTYRESDGELVLKGTISSTKYDGKIISYGLSVEGPLLWIIGLPAGTIMNDLSIKLSLQDRSSGKVLWGNSYSTTNDHGAYWIYSLPSDMMYAGMLENLMPTILSDLERAIKGP